MIELARNKKLKHYIVSINQVSTHLYIPARHLQGTKREAHMNHLGQSNTKLVRKVSTIFIGKSRNTCKITRFNLKHSINHRVIHPSVSC